LVKKGKVFRLYKKRGRVYLSTQKRGDLVNGGTGFAERRGGVHLAFEKKNLPAEGRG